MGTLCSCASARQIRKGTAKKRGASMEEIDTAVQVIISELTETIKVADLLSCYEQALLLCRLKMTLAGHVACF